MNSNKSETARFRQQLAVEEAVRLGLYVLASGIACHDFPLARMQRGAHRTLRLIHLGKRAQAQALMATDDEAWQPKRSTTGKRVLVIEPARPTRVLLTCHLQQLGHHVMTFKDYDTAIAAFPRLGLQPPDLAFVALHADRPESVQALVQLSAVCLQTMLIMMIPQQDGRQLLVQRIAGVILAVPLVKPFRIQEVLTLLAPPMQTSTQQAVQERQIEGEWRTEKPNAELARTSSLILMS